MPDEDAQAIEQDERGRESRFLIVNADDFGRTERINSGLIEAHEKGIVTSASLMVLYPAAEQAAAYARKRPQLSVGLHLDLCEWRYRHGEWQPVYERIDVANADAITTELERQAAIFRELMGDGPTHLDSHQHAHMSEPARAIILDYAQRHNLALRACDDRIAFCGSFYGQTGRGEPVAEAISVEQLTTTLNSLGNGWTELGCHPGRTGDWRTDYSDEREQELQTLCDPRVRESLDRAGIALGNFLDFNLAQRAAARTGVEPVHLP